MFLLMFSSISRNYTFNILFSAMFSQLAKCAIFACIGLGMEVIFTSVWSTHVDQYVENLALPSDSSTKINFLWGWSSLYYFPLYMLVPFLIESLHSIWFKMCPTNERKDGRMVIPKWYFRFISYALLFHISEFLGMFLLRQILGQSPSEEQYYQSGRSIYGLTRIDYFPFFGVGGMFLEYVYLLIRK